MDCKLPNGEYCSVCCNANIVDHDGLTILNINSPLAHCEHSTDGTCPRLTGKPNEGCKVIDCLSSQGAAFFLARVGKMMVDLRSLNN